MNPPATPFQPASIQPSDEQIAIQTAKADTVLVRANAGAAKTTTLALRVAEALHSGVAPEHILALTYTEPACEAMKGALLKIGVPRSAIKALRIQTFDAFAAQVLRSIEPSTPPFQPTHEAVAPWVWQAMHDAGMSADSGVVERFLATSRRLKGTLALDTAIWSGEAITDDFAEDAGIEPGLLQIFQAYEHMRYPKREGVDQPRFRWAFDATYDLAYLLADPEQTTCLDEVPAWPRRLRHLLVDEMHDLNLAMFTIVRKLADTNRHAGFCGVGDFDQVIHAVAGAERRFMDDKLLDMGERRVQAFRLTATHRFSRSLAFMAGSLADKPYASAAKHPTAVRCRLYPEADGSSCEDLIVASARDWKSASGGDMAEFAVLLRHAWQSVAVENALLKANLPYVTKGFTSYLMQPEVLLIRALLAVATGDYAQLDSAETRAELVRAVVFFCGIELGHELSEAETPEQRMQNAIRHITAQKEALRPFIEFQVLDRADKALAGRMRRAIAIAADAQAGGDWFDRFLDALDVQTWVRRVFVERQRRADAMAYFDGLKQAARTFTTPKAFFESLGEHETRLKDSPSAQKQAVRAALARKGALTLATISEVKGLEFDQVLMPYLAQGLFPAALAPSKLEERNLFYVGITRARKGLTLLACRQAPSEFIKATGVELT